MPAGSLRISTKIDNSKLDKDIAELENKIKKLQRNNSKNSLEQSNLQNEINKYDELCLKADEYHHKIRQLNIEKKAIFNANPELTVSVDSPQYASIKNQITEMEQKYKETTQEIDKQAPKIEKIRLKLQEVKDKQIENNTKMAEYNKQLQESQKKQFDLNYSTEGISKSLSKGITKILRYGMALFSIRSIYGLLSNAMNSWLSGNSKGAKQLRSDIDYMKNAIGGVLSPILKYIVNLLYQALGFTGALIKAFTGVDIFAGSVADYMSSITSSASKTNKELKKQLTNFDRINKLEKNDTSSGGSSGGVVMPSQDLSSIMSKYTEQAEKLKEVFDEIKDIVIGIGIAIVGWKLASALGASTGLSLSIALMASSLYFFWKGIKGFQDGEITNKDVFNTIAGVIGVGVATAIGAGSLGLAFSASALLGLSVSLFFANWAIASYGQGKTPDWVEDLFGFTDISGAGTGKNGANLMKKLGIPENVKFNISVSFYFLKGAIEILNDLFPGLRDTLFEKLKDVILDVADKIEKIPIIGQGIAWAIRGAITASESDMTKTLEDTTTSSIETAKTKINKSATEAGGEAGTNWMSEMKQKINSDKDNLETTMRDTVTDASNNSKSTVKSNGQELGNELMKETKNSIQLAKDSLGTTIKQTTDGATNSSLSNVEQSGKKLGIKEIEGVKLGQANQRSSLSSNLSSVVRTANNNVDTSSSNSIGSNIVRGINSGINNNKWSLFSTMTSLGNRLLSNFKSALGIHSPSREMASLAKFIPLGIAEGIDSTSDKAVGSMKDLVADIEDTASNMNVQYNIPKISRNAISYVPKQAISTNEIQRSIIGNSDILDKLLKENSMNKEYTFILPVSVDGEVFYKTIIKKKEKDLFATNGGY